MDILFGPSGKSVISSVTNFTDISCLFFLVSHYITPESLPRPTIISACWGGEALRIPQSGTVSSEETGRQVKARQCVRAWHVQKCKPRAPRNVTYGKLYSALLSSVSRKHRKTIKKEKATNISYINYYISARSLRVN